MASSGLVASDGKWRGTLHGIGQRIGAILCALALLGATIGFAFTLVSYHVTDPALNTAAGGPVKNIFGEPGAWIADLALSIFGPAVALILPLGLIWGLRLWRGSPIGRWGRALFVALLAAAVLGIGLALFRGGSISGLPAGYGGTIGLAGATLVGLGLAQIADPMVGNIVRLGAAAVFGIAGISFWLWGLGLVADERDWLLRRGGYARRPNEPYDEDDIFADGDDVAGIERVVLPTRPPRHAPIDESDAPPPPVIADRKKASAPSPRAARERQSSLPLGSRYISTYPNIHLFDRISTFTLGGLCQNFTFSQDTHLQNFTLIQLFDFQAHAFWPSVIHAPAPGFSL